MLLSGISGVLGLVYMNQLETSYVPYFSPCAFLKTRMMEDICGWARHRRVQPNDREFKCRSHGI